MRRHGNDLDPLGQFWDDLVSVGSTTDRRGEGPSAGGASVVRGLHAMDETPGPTHELVQRMWADAVRLAAAAPASAPATLNGHQAVVRPVARDRTQGFVTVLLTIAMALAAGFIAGALAGGLGSRLIMRLAGSLTSARNRGLVTDAGNSVGELSLAGTMDLVMFAGLMGALAGVLYVAVRWMLPWSGWRRGLLFGGIVFAIGGADVLDRGTNPDYRQFGIAGLNVCLFGLLPVLFGLICAPLADAWIGRVQGWQPRRFGWIAVAMTAPFVAIFVIGLLANVTSMPWLTLFFLPGGVKLLARWHPGFFDRRVPTLPDSWLRVATYGAIAVPCLAGLVQVAVAIDRILG